MQLRRATMDDALDVLAWRNDPHTIAMSKTFERVDEAGHLRWFAKAVDDPNRFIVIAAEGGQKIGMVRFDRSEDAWLVSINVAPKERGRGHGTAMLSAAVELHRSTVGLSRIVAEVKEANPASIRLFTKCGFVKTELQHGLWQMELRGLAVRP